MEIIWLQRASPDVPWGFHIQGGRDSGLPLSVQRVNPQGVAGASTLRAGDVILKINNQSATNLSSQQGYQLMSQADNLLQLTIRKQGTVAASCPVSPTPMSQQVSFTAPTSPVNFRGFSPVSDGLPSFHKQGSFQEDPQDSRLRQFASLPRRSISTTGQPSHGSQTTDQYDMYGRKNSAPYGIGSYTIGSQISKPTPYRPSAGNIYSTHGRSGSDSSGYQTSSYGASPNSFDNTASMDIQGVSRPTNRQRGQYGQGPGPGVAPPSYETSLQDSVLAHAHRNPIDHQGIPRQRTTSGSSQRNLQTQASTEAEYEHAENKPTPPPRDTSLQRQFSREGMLSGRNLQRQISSKQMQNGSFQAPYAESQKQSAFQKLESNVYSTQPEVQPVFNKEPLHMRNRQFDEHQTPPSLRKQNSQDYQHETKLYERGPSNLAQRSFDQGQSTTSAAVRHPANVYYDPGAPGYQSTIAQQKMDQRPLLNQQTSFELEGKRGQECETIQEFHTPPAPEQITVRRMMHGQDESARARACEADQSNTRACDVPVRYNGEEQSNMQTYTQHPSKVATPPHSNQGQQSHVYQRQASGESVTSSSSRNPDLQGSPSPYRRQNPPLSSSSSSFDKTPQFSDSDRRARQGAGATCEVYNSDSRGGYPCAEANPPYSGSHVAFSSRSVPRQGSVQEPTGNNEVSSSSYQTGRQDSTGSGVTTSWGGDRSRPHLQRQTSSGSFAQTQHATISTPSYPSASYVNNDYVEKPSSLEPVSPTVSNKSDSVINSFDDILSPFEKFPNYYDEFLRKSNESRVNGQSSTSLTVGNQGRSLEQQEPKPQQPEEGKSFSNKMYGGPDRPQPAIWRPSQQSQQQPVQRSVYQTPQTFNQQPQSSYSQYGSPQGQQQYDSYSYDQQYGQNPYGVSDFGGGFSLPQGKPSSPYSGQPQYGRQNQYQSSTDPYGNQQQYGNQYGSEMYRQQEQYASQPSSSYGGQQQYGSPYTTYNTVSSPVSPPVPPPPSHNIPPPPPMGAPPAPPPPPPAPPLPSQGWTTPKRQVYRPDNDMRTPGDGSPVPPGSQGEKIPDAVLNQMIKQKGSGTPKPFAYIQGGIDLKEFKNRKNRPPPPVLPKSYRGPNLDDDQMSEPASAPAQKFLPQRPQQPYLHNVVMAPTTTPVRPTPNHRVYHSLPTSPDFTRRHAPNFTLPPKKSIRQGDSKPSKDYEKSAVYQMIQESENPGRPRQQQQQQQQQQQRAKDPSLRHNAEDDEMRFSGLHSKKDIPSKAFARLNKMTLNDDDDSIAQVASNNYDNTDNAEDPVSKYEQTSIRYTGKHIPSPSFRILQNWAAYDESKASQTKPQPKADDDLDDTDDGLPETLSGDEATDKRYMGGNIPSRSFKMLQMSIGQDSGSTDQSHHENEHQQMKAVEEPEKRSAHAQNAPRKLQIVTKSRAVPESDEMPSTDF